MKVISLKEERIETVTKNTQFSGGGGGGTDTDSQTSSHFLINFFYL